MNNETITLIATVASAVAAIGAVIVASMVGRTQDRIQKKQLQQDLFDRRYAVYAAIETFLMSLLRTGGEFDQNAFTTFKSAVEPVEAEFLCGPEAAAYVKEIIEVTMKLTRLNQEKYKKAGLGQDATPESHEVSAVLADVSDRLMKKRQTVFRQYLKLYEANL
jgi:hypothetical protein